MAETKPTKVPRWADTGTRVEPAEAKKDSGWVAPEKPSDTFFNWLQGIGGDWLKWINERIFDNDQSGATNPENDLTVKSPQDGTLKARLDVGGLVTPLESQADATTSDPADSRVTSALSTFVTNGVEVGDIVELSGFTTVDGYYIVKTVVSETELDVTDAFGADPSFPAEGPANVDVYTGGHLRVVGKDGIGLKTDDSVGASTRIRANPAGTPYRLTLPTGLPASGLRGIRVDSLGDLFASGNIADFVTLGVAASGAEFEGTDQLSAAITEAQTRNVPLLVGEGTFTQSAQILISSPVHIIGVGERLNTIIEGTGATDGQATLRASGDRIIIENVTVTQTNAGFDNSCIEINDGLGSIVRDCHIIHSGQGTAGECAGIVLRAAEQALILNNHVTIASTSSGTVRRACIQIGRAQNSPVPNITSRNFVAFNYLQHLTGSSQTDITGVYVVADNAGAGNDNADDNIIMGNELVSSLGDYGLVMRAGSGDSVKGNVVNGNNFDTSGLVAGIELDSAAAATLEGNAISGNVLAADTGSTPRDMVHAVGLADKTRNGLSLHVTTGTNPRGPSYVTNTDNPTPSTSDYRLLETDDFNMDRW